LAEELVPKKFYISESDVRVKWKTVKDENAKGKYVLIDLGKEYYVQKLEFIGDTNREISFLADDPLFSLKQSNDWLGFYSGKYKEEKYLVNTDYELGRYIVIKTTESVTELKSKLKIFSQIPKVEVGNILVKQTTNNVNITFGSNVAVESEVIYDIERNVILNNRLSNVSKTPGFYKKHIVELGNLPKNNYWFLIIVKDKYGRTGKSMYKKFLRN
jgi:hypothetical protein